MTSEFDSTFSMALPQAATYQTISEILFAGFGGDAKDGEGVQGRVCEQHGSLLLPRMPQEIPSRVSGREEGRL